MELIIQAGILLLGQAVELGKLWLKVGEEGLTAEQIAEEIQDIIKRSEDLNKKEWDRVLGRG